MAPPTPDQPVRVFISATLSDLAAERSAARWAVEGLRLVPVLFALEQSQIFVGVYWQDYRSAIEDEYERAEDRPKLIYVRERAPACDPRLTALLDRIRAN